MKQGQRGCCPFPLHPKSPLKRSYASLRTRSPHFQLTKPNTSGTIITPASLRSGTPFGFLQESCSASPEYPHRRRHQGRRVFVADWYAAGTLARPRAVGSPKQLAARSNRPRDFFCRERLYGAPACFMKKTKKTPKQEIDLALKRKMGTES